uniref:Uncharacterized protein n=1 Tax=Anguilla anguilla TaxID=7936 RepID=A0A0E9PT13_ANGAN
MLSSGCTVQFGPRLKGDLPTFICVKVIVVKSQSAVKWC